jgi:hypothetical protein
VLMAGMEREWQALIDADRAEPIEGGMPAGEARMAGR